MKSNIAKAIRMKYSPVALMWSDEKPKGAIEFAEGKWGCLMSLAASAAKGRVAAASRETCGCSGGYVGAGFGDKFAQIPGGIEHFLSSGNPDLIKTEEGRKLAEAHPDMLHGERYIKTPELARKFVESLPIMDIPAKYIVFKPLEMLEGYEVPKSIIFMVNPDQLSALVVLANYGRETTDNVTMPMGAGCHQTGILVYREGESEHPKAVVGLTDLSARKYTNQALGKDIL
ncbi:MAG: DUF169 domain-containing protein, partial [Bacteroidales bacterium]|nr:DUF169 domain-containing protein [Bacteroidales bacterium]